MIYILYFIEGPSGSGKTEYIRQLILKMVKADKKIMLIVPEQYSFETERAMLRLLGPSLVNKIEILNFNRMLSFVLRGDLGDHDKRLDKGGKSIIMNLAINQVKDELVLYRSERNRANIINMMLELLQELKTCCISTEELMKSCEHVKNKELKQKIYETSLILGAYNSIIENDYLDPLDDLTLIYEGVSSSDYFKEYTVFFDAFTNFNNQELKILNVILCRASDVYISMPIERIAKKVPRTGFQDRSDEFDLFSGVIKTIRKIKTMAEDCNIKIAKPIYINSLKRFKNEELKVLSQNIFRLDKIKYDKNPEDIIVYNAKNQYDEIDFICCSIKQLVIEENYRYKDFAVIVRELEVYNSIIDNIFKKYDIPYFMDRRESIDSKPVMNTVLTAFNILDTSYSSDEIFKYLKNGLTDLSVEDIAFLENYALMWNISGKQWLSEFKSHPRGFEEHLTDEDELNLERINKLRLKVITPLLNFAVNIKNRTGDQIAEAVYILLKEINAYSNLKKSSEELAQFGAIDLSDDELRVWDILMNILNQAAMTLKGKAIRRKEFAEILKLVISSSEIASIPKGLDQVTIGKADRIRTSDPKVTFALGVNEGEFPKMLSSKGVFSNLERKQILDLGIPVYDSIEGRSIEERFIAYNILSSPSEKLFVSFCSSDVKGSSKTPSEIIREIKNIFPYIEFRDRLSKSPVDFVWSDRPGFSLTAKLWSQGSRISETLKFYYSSRRDYSDKMALMSNAALGRELNIRDRSTALSIFGKDMRISASQAEKYHVCKFQYFCMYGLRVKPRKVAQFNLLEYGSFVHYILEKIFKQNSVEFLLGLSEQELKNKIKSILSDYILRKLGGLDDKNHRLKFQFYRVADTTLLLIEHMLIELSQSGFSVSDCELSISDHGELRPLMLKCYDGGSVYVEGKIDRVDIRLKDDKSYIRVIDYKTGNKEFKLSNLLYGMNMQMIIYMGAILENGEDKYGNIIPAGFLYMPSIRPLVNTQRHITEEKLEAEKNKKLRMDGLVIDDPVVINGVDTKNKINFIPFFLSSKGSLDFGCLLSSDQMRLIIKKAESLLIDMANTLKSGNISPDPKCGDVDSCEWCDYKCVCGYESDNAYIEVKHFDKDEVIKMLEADEMGEKLG